MIAFCYNTTSPASSPKMAHSHILALQLNSLITFVYDFLCYKNFTRNLRIKFCGTLFHDIQSLEVLHSNLFFDFSVSHNKISIQTTTSIAYPKETGSV